MKKCMATALCVVLLCALLCGCTSTNQNQNETKTLSIITTIFPLYDWTQNIVSGTDAQLRMLLDTGVDLHSFQPTVQDIVDISDCDVFIYVGGESDKWVQDALKEKNNQNMVVIDLMEVLADNVKEEELVEGMQGEEEEEEEGPEYDEHIWLSLKNAAICSQAICDKLCTLDPEHKDIYTKNTTFYLAKINQLDAEYEEMVKSANTKTLVFGDRFPFRYLTDDYGLTYFAAFIGCSAESEASFDTVVFLANKVDENALRYILKIESSDGSIAKTIKENTKLKNQGILSLDSLQSVTAKDVQKGVTYLGAMSDNKKILEKALQN
ncbi:MAG: zinc ABC transporter substrate-binding protein [Clostridia bacterium]|nr:zinc ABC transporter substrate-binding protein [Clostridia bacterium]